MALLEKGGYWTKLTSVEISGGFSVVRSGGGLIFLLFWSRRGLGHCTALTFWFLVRSGARPGRTPALDDAAGAPKLVAKVWGGESVLFTQKEGSVALKTWNAIKK